MRKGKGAGDASHSQVQLRPGTAITLLCPPASKPRPGYNANRGEDDHDACPEPETYLNYYHLLSRESQHICGSRYCKHIGIVIRDVKNRLMDGELINRGLSNVYNIVSRWQNFFIISIF